MLHSIKLATVGSLAVKNKVQDGEYEGLRAQLGVVNSSVQDGLRHIEVMQKTYENQIKNTERFYTGLHRVSVYNSYNNTTSGGALAMTLRQAIDGVHGAVLGRYSELVNPVGEYNSTVTQVKKYLNDVKNVLGTNGCGKVDVAYRDVVMYSQKVDKLEATRGQPPSNVQKLMGSVVPQESPDEKCQRNVNKLNIAKGRYDALLDEMCQNMRSLLQKQSYMTMLMFQVYTSFTESMCNVTQNTMNPIFDFCNAPQNQQTPQQSQQGLPQGPPTGAEAGPPRQSFGGVGTPGQSFGGVGTPMPTEHQKQQQANRFCVSPCAPDAPLQPTPPALAPTTPPSYQTPIHEQQWYGGMMPGPQHPLYASNDTTVDPKNVTP